MAEVETKVVKCKDYLLADLDDSKLVYVLKKLFQLDVTIDILQRTGICKIVNTLRKKDGTVADRAKEIVAKWKEMVSAEQARLQEEEIKANDNSGSLGEAEKSNDEISEFESEEEPVETLDNKIAAGGKHIVTSDMFNKSKLHQRHYRNKHTESEQSDEDEEISNNINLTSSDQRKEKNSRERDTHKTSSRKHSYSSEGVSHSKDKSHKKEMVIFNDHDVSSKHSSKGNNEQKRSDHHVKGVHSSNGDRSHSHDVDNCKEKNRHSDQYKSNTHHSKRCSSFEKGERKKILKTDKSENKGHKSNSSEDLCDTNRKHSDSELKSGYEKRERSFSAETKHKTKEKHEEHGAKNHHEISNIDKERSDGTTHLNKDRTDTFAEKQERLECRGEICKETKSVWEESRHSSKGKDDNKESSKHGKEKDMHKDAERTEKHSSHTEKNGKEKQSNETLRNIDTSKDTDKNEQERKYADGKNSKENIRRDRDKSSLPTADEHKSRSKSSSGLNNHQPHSRDVKTKILNEKQEPHITNNSCDESKEKNENKIQRSGSESNANLACKKSHIDLISNDENNFIEKHKSKDSNREKYHSNSKSDVSGYIKDSKYDMLQNKSSRKGERSRSYYESPSKRSSRSSSVKSESPTSKSFDSDKELKMYQSVDDSSSEENYDSSLFGDEATTSNCKSVKHETQRDSTEFNVSRKDSNSRYVLDAKQSDKSKAARHELQRLKSKDDTCGHIERKKLKSCNLLEKYKHSAERNKSTSNINATVKSSGKSSLEKKNYAKENREHNKKDGVSERLSEDELNHASNTKVSVHDSSRDSKQKDRNVSADVSVRNDNRSSREDHQISSSNKSSRSVSHSSSKHGLRIGSEKEFHSATLESVTWPLDSDQSHEELKIKCSDSKDYKRKYDEGLNLSLKKSKSLSLDKSASKDKLGNIKVGKRDISEYSGDISPAETTHKQGTTSFVNDSDNESHISNQEISVIGDGKSNKTRNMLMQSDKHAGCDIIKQEAETDSIDEGVDRKSAKSHKHSKSHKRSHVENDNEPGLRHGKKSSKEKHKHKSKKHKHTEKSSKHLSDRHRTDMENFTDNSEAVEIENVQSPAKKPQTSEEDDTSNRYNDIRAKFKVKKISESKTLGIGGKVEGLKRKAMKDEDAPTIKRQASGDLTSYLPSTQAQYQPSRLVGVAEKSGAEEHDPGSFLKARNTRTVVYSGKKHTTVSEVHSLFDLCVKVLQDNIDCIVYVSGTPFTVLKPVLGKCTPAQLYKKEDYNPHLLQDTDCLWQAHCEKDFRGSKPDEMETWRELYLRKMDEKNEKLKSVRAHITKSIAKAAPARTAKLAFIENAAKPPREVRRMQAKYGTANVVQKAEVKKHYTAFDMIIIGRAKQEMADRARNSPMMQKTVHMTKTLQKR